VEPPEVALDVRLADVPTVLVAAWSADGAISGHLEVEAGDRAWSTPHEPAALEHRTLVLGAGPEVAVSLRVVGEQDGLEVSSPWVSVTTGSLAADLPVIDVEVLEDTVDGYLAAPIVISEELDGAEEAAIIVLGPDGELVWHRMVSGVWPSRVRFASIGGLFYLVDGSIRHVDWEGQEVEVASGEHLHHDFAQLPDGGVAFLDHDVIDRGGCFVFLDKITERSVSGDERTAWSIEPYLETLGVDVDVVECSDHGSDFSHANSLEYVPATDGFLLGLPGIHRWLLVDRADGSLSWVLADDGGGSLQWADPVSLDLTHGLSLRDDQLALFVNQSDANDCSQVWRFQIDQQEGVLTELPGPSPEDCLVTFALGGVALPTPDGLAVSWGTESIIERYNDEGRALRRFTINDVAAVGYLDSAEGL
jgi:hypothetical protein